MIPLRWIELDKSQTEPDEFPWNLPAIANLKRLEFTAPVTFFVGEKCFGQVNMVEAIAVAARLNPED
ncbi:MAG: hypothetical protein WD651_00500 [Acidimicrobiia bacterium]